MIELHAQPRSILGSKVTSLRKQGFLPGIVYGEGVPSQPITVLFTDFQRAYKAAGESTILTLDVGEKIYNVLIHDVARHATKNQPVHADFYAIRMDKLIRTNVPLIFVGDSDAIKNNGGILVRVMHEVEVEALPKDLPHELPVNLALLSSFGSKILIKDIPVIPGVEIIADGDEIVALAEAPRTAEALAELEQSGGPGEVVNVKTEQEEKRAAKETAAAEEE